MFNKKLEERVDRLMDEVGERLSKIEKQLKPEPTFNAGELVTFCVAGDVMSGEIVGKGITRGIFGSYESSDAWMIRYLDKNEVVQEVSIKEENIRDDECPICDLVDQIDELEKRLKSLEVNKK